MRRPFYQVALRIVLAAIFGGIALGLVAASILNCGTHVIMQSGHPWLAFPIRDAPKWMGESDGGPVVCQEDGGAER